VRVHYRYAYTAPVADLSQRLIVVPPDRHGDQRLLAHRLEVRGADGADVAWEVDPFANRVCRVRARRVAEAIDFEARYRVERGRAGPPAPSPDDVAAWRARCLQPTALTAPDARLRAAARRAAAGATTARARAERAHEWAAGAIGYQYGLTDVRTPAAMALYLGKGVCQDYAHILLCALRLLDVPARYVSGHLLGEGGSHAWVEALVEDRAAPGGWTVVAYDPTHRRRTHRRYITVAVGRDYGDVSPTSGYFTGPAIGRLSSSKQAEVVADGTAGSVPP
jgi:transglutaminase-like putative cysteine protease